MTCPFCGRLAEFCLCVPDDAPWVEPALPGIEPARHRRDIPTPAAELEQCGEEPGVERPPLPGVDQ